MKTFEPDDPMALVGVRFDEELDEGALVEMARAIVEEYALLGCSSDAIMRLFRTPGFRMAHRVLEKKGEAFVRELIAEVEAIREQATARKQER